MNTTNQEIVARIKEARQQKNMTQQQLATILGKTAAAISDLERGKVQVSACDLAVIAQSLEKPIEYFYGSNIMSGDIQNIMAYLENETPDRAKQTLEMVNMFFRLQHIGEIVQGEDREATPEEMGAFVTDFMTFSKVINDLTGQINVIRDQLSQVLQDHETNFPDNPAGG